MKYDVIVDQQNKVYQYYPVRLTKWMSKAVLEGFLKTFRGYKRADIMVKSNHKGKGNKGTAWAIYIRRSNQSRRKEDAEVKMKLSDFLLGQVYLNKKREGISLLQKFI